MERQRRTIRVSSASIQDCPIVGRCQMRFIDTVYCIISAAGITLGQVLIKRASIEWQVSGTLLNLRVISWVLSAFLLYGVAALLWMYILKRVPLSLAYPLLATTFVLVPLAGVLIFDERLQWTDWASFGLIFSGIALGSLGRDA